MCSFNSKYYVGIHPLIALFPAIVGALTAIVLGGAPTTPLIALGFTVWMVWALSDIKLVWKNPDLDLELDLARDGLKGLGVFVLYAIVQAVMWHAYIPNVIVYKAYLVAYYAAHSALGYGAAGALQVGLSFGLWLARKSDKPEE